MGDTDTLEAFTAKFRVDDLLVHRSRAWSWSVRPAQPTLGSGVLSLNRYAARLSEVTSDEMAELSGMVRTIESAVAQAFDHEIMNYLALMMVDHHVHYHVIPRYGATRRFGGFDWVDDGWPALPALSDAQHAASPEVLIAVRDALREGVR